MATERVKIIRFEEEPEVEEVVEPVYELERLDNFIEKCGVIPGVILCCSIMLTLNVVLRTPIKSAERVLKLVKANGPKEIS